MAQTKTTPAVYSIPANTLVCTMQALRGIRCNTQTLEITGVSKRMKIRLTALLPGLDIDDALMQAEGGLDELNGMTKRLQQFTAQSLFFQWISYLFKVETACVMFSCAED